MDDFLTTETIFSDKLIDISNVDFESLKHDVGVSTTLKEVHYACAKLSKLYWVGEVAASGVPNMLSIISRRSMQIYKSGNIVPRFELQHMHNIVHYVDVFCNIFISQMHSGNVSDIMALHGTFSIHIEPNLMSMIEESFIRTTNFTLPGTFSAILWSYAKLSISPSPDLWNLLRYYIFCKLKYFCPSTVVSIMWSIATMRMADKDVQIAILQQIPNVIFCLNHMQISKVVWAMGVFKCYPGAEVMDCIERAVLRNGAIFHDGIAMVKVLWGFSRVLYRLPNEYLEELETCIFHRRGELMPYALARTCWAFASISYIVDEKFVNDVAVKIQENVSIFTLDDFCSLIWSLAVFGLEKIEDTRFFEVVSEAIYFWQEAIKDNRRHLMQCRDFCLMSAKLSKIPEKEIPPHIAYHPEQHLDMSDFRTHVIKYVQRVIMNKTNQRYSFKACVRHKVYGFVLQMYITDGKKEFAVEAVGPGWFCRPGTHMNGHRCIRQRLIVACGIQLIVFPFYTWYEKRMAKKLHEYVQEMLSPILNT